MELSDILVQIVDARNPEVFYCSDLVSYAESVGPEKQSILLLNKADLLTEEQRELWAENLNAQGIKFVFFSAIAEDEEDDEDDNDGEGEAGEEGEQDQKILPDIVIVPEMGTSHVFTRAELLGLLEKWKGKTVGLVGYPNVGKSSTINCLLGEKKVAVAITPGKTKHYQTLFLGNGVRICDCPGLVFPNFSLSKSDLVLNGILPVDQLRDYLSPATLLADRIPRDVIERLYGIQLAKPGFEEDPDRKPTAAEVLSGFALARGYMTSNFGNPDQSRASRTVLKDYVSGKLLFCHAPPTISQEEYSVMTYEALRTRLPCRSQPKPYKPINHQYDEHIIETSVGFVARKPGQKPVFANSKKHFKGKK